MRMPSPYLKEELRFADPAFRSIPCTVVLTMLGSSRRKSYLRQLFKHRPTSRVIVLHNRGFKTGLKPGVYSCAADLWHANVRASRIGAKGPLLILEDDVRFLPSFRAQAREIEKFLLQMQGPCAYNLGCCPYVSLPWKGHIRVLQGGDCHAMLYNREALSLFQNMTIRWLHDLEIYRRMKVYTGRQPHAIQKKVDTENSDDWNVLGLPMLLVRVLGANSDVRYYTNAHVAGRYGGVATIGLIVLAVTTKVLYDCRKRAALQSTLRLATP